MDPARPSAGAGAGPGSAPARARASAASAAPSACRAAATWACADTASGCAGLTVTSFSASADCAATSAAAAASRCFWASTTPATGPGPRGDAARLPGEELGLHPRELALEAGEHGIRGPRLDPRARREAGPGGFAAPGCTGA